MCPGLFERYRFPGNNMQTRYQLKSTKTDFVAGRIAALSNYDSTEQCLVWMAVWLALSVGNSLYSRTFLPGSVRRSMCGELYAICERLPRLIPQRSDQHLMRRRRPC